MKIEFLKVILINKVNKEMALEGYGIQIKLGKVTVNPFFLGGVEGRGSDNILSALLYLFCLWSITLYFFYPRKTVYTIKK